MLINHFVVCYESPKRIHTDHGRNFESTLIKEMCEVLCLEKSHTTPDHPMGYGVTEKYNQTLIQILRTLEGEEKTNSKVHEAPFVHAYNASRHASTKFSPFYLMFSCKPRLDIDLGEGEYKVEAVSPGYGMFVESLRKIMKVLYSV